MSRREPPGPNGLPFIGTGIEFMRDPLAYRQRIADEYGGVVCVQNFGKDFYVVTDPSVISRVLVTENHKFVTPEIVKEMIGPVFGEGLLLSDGDHWKTHRELLQPAFYRRRLKTYTEVMVEYTERLLEDWEHGQTYDIQAEMETLSLRILVRSLFGTDMGHEKTIRDAASAFVARFEPEALLVQFALPDWLPTPINRRFDAAVDELDEIVYEVIEQRGTHDDRDDLLSWMLSGTDDGIDLSNKHVRDEMLNLLLAGHETTALTMAYTLDRLVRNPAVERKLIEELDDVLGDDTPTFADLDDLDYLDTVLTESLRMFPPAHEVRRQPTETVVLGEYMVPEGGMINMSAWAAHRDERWYDDPDQFRPERWTDEFETRLPDFAYFPFGGGPHVCIGKDFALVSAKMVLATLLRQYEFEYPSPTPLELEAKITIRPKNDMEMLVRER